MPPPGGMGFAGDVVHRPYDESRFEASHPLDNPYTS